MTGRPVDQRLDGDVAFDVAPAAPRGVLSKEAATQRRMELLANPIVAVRAALDSSSRVANRRTEGAATLVDVTTAASNTFTLAVTTATGLPLWVRWVGPHENLGDITYRTEFIKTEAASGSVANSPTLSMMATQAGLILGTAAYMSPEQAKGFPADHRSDIFSFGTVLFEMLSGRQPFQGDTAPDVLASVLVRDPDATRLPSDLNPRLIELVKRCLEKNPRKRWQAIGDVRAELESLMAAPRAVAMPGYADRPQGPLWRRALPAVLCAVVAAALAGAAAWRLKPEPKKPVYRFSIALRAGSLHDSRPSDD